MDPGGHHKPGGQHTHQAASVTGRVLFSVCPYLTQRGGRVTGPDSTVDPGGHHKPGGQHTHQAAHLTGRVLFSVCPYLT